MSDVFVFYAYFIREQSMTRSDENTANLKDLMRLPPMTASQHMIITRKRIEQRRMMEDVREDFKMRGKEVAEQ